MIRKTQQMITVYTDKWAGYRSYTTIKTTVWFLFIPVYISTKVV